MDVFTAMITSNLNIGSLTQALGILTERTKFLYQQIYILTFQRHLVLRNIRHQHISCSQTIDSGYLEKEALVNTRPIPLYNKGPSFFVLFISETALFIYDRGSRSTNTTAVLLLAREQRH